MRITITKGRSDDAIVGIRDDGSRFGTRFPKKGPVPHDAVHLIVEDALGLRNGFWGMVASGYHPDEIAAIAHAAGHASAARAQVPEAHIVQLLQAERIVECFEADLWSGSTGDPIGLVDLARIACDSSHVALPPLGPDEFAVIQAAVRTLAGEWVPAPDGHVASFDWPEGD